MNNAESTLCSSCGASISPTSKFCEHCGAEQEAVTEAFTEEAPTEAIQPEPPTQAIPAEPSEPPSPPPADSIAAAPRTPPQLAEFGQLLRDYSQLPGVQMAALSALIGAAVVLVAGLIVSIVLPDESVVHFSVSGSSDLLKEWFGQSATMTLATVDVDFGGPHVALRFAPLLFALFPIGGCALGAHLLSSRTSSMPAALRYAWAAAVAIPFALIMLLVSLMAGTLSEGTGSLSPSEGSVFLLSLLWGAIGGMVGVAWSARGSGAELTPTTWFARGLLTAREALRPLGVSLLIFCVVGTGIWVVQTVRDASEARGSRSLTVALVDDVLYAGDFGYRYQALGSGSDFRLLNDDLLSAAASSNLEDDSGDNGSSFSASPIPISSSKLSELIDAQGLRALGAKYRIFDYGDVLPAWMFGPLLLVLLVVPAFLALYAGFAIAGANGARTPLLGAAWGAAVGPIWAVVMAVLTSLTQDVGFGQVDGDSLFVLTLLLGAALGALGGAGAVQRRTATPESPATSGV